MIKRQIKFFLTLLLLVCFAFGAAWVKFLMTPIIHDDQGYKYIVPSGTSIKIVVDDLYAKKIIENRFFLNLLIRIRGNAQELKAGEFLFPKGATPYQILNQMVTGTGMVYRVFTIIPGWNFKELREALSLEGNLRHTLQKLNDQELMFRLKHPELPPEGQFFPDTYYFTEGSSDVALLRNAFKTMQTKLTKAWLGRDNNLPYKDQNEALIAASLIEKEAYLAEERPIIAGVIVNRLRLGMLLQIDPTVIYGMGLRYAGKIRKDDLIQNTPYNTYVHKGLPPTPIAMPSLESIMAVLHPQQNNYIYFVARGDGSHQFSASYAEHQKAVALTKQLRPWFFNVDLMKYYFMKSHSFPLQSSLARMLSNYLTK